MNIDINLTWIFIFLIICLVIFLLHNLGGLKLFSNHDNKLTGQFLDKFPLVSPEFMKKSAKLQNAENNQEIHEINKRIDELEVTFEELNKNIQKQLDAILEELDKRNG
jgi:vacuolar-type H+-ATPase subunit I/STV1